MFELANWLGEIEMQAFEIYSNGAKQFRKDTEFHEFLTTLANDEYSHSQMMKRASDIYDKVPFNNNIHIDTVIRERISKPFEEISEKINNGNLSKEEFLKFIVDSEFSEWNEIFVYSLTTAKSLSPSFNPDIALIDHHRRYIERIIDKTTGSTREAFKLSRIPHVWQENILIIDPSQIIINLLKSIFSGMGNIDSASNCEEAMEKIESKYYGAIIADIVIAPTGGVDLCKGMIKKFPGIQERLYIYSSSTDDNYLNFFKENKIRYGIRPKPVSELKDNISAILGRKPNTRAILNKKLLY